MRQLDYNQAFMLFLITLVASTFGSGDANARLRTTEKTKYFDVSGATPVELRSSLRRAYPDFDARTNFHFQSRYTWKATGKKCRMTSVTVDLTLEIILPRIKAGNELAPEVQKEWDRFIAGVINHENEHVRLYKAGAADLEKNFDFSRVPARACNVIHPPSRRMALSECKR